MNQIKTTSNVNESLNRCKEIRLDIKEGLKNNICSNFNCNLLSECKILDNKLIQNLIKRCANIEKCQMSVVEQYLQLYKTKLLGDQCLKQKDLSSSMEKYQHVISTLMTKNNATMQSKQLQGLLRNTLNNQSICMYQDKQYWDCITICKQILNTRHQNTINQSNNGKIHARIGQSYLALWNLNKKNSSSNIELLNKSYQSFEKATKINPSLEKFLNHVRKLIHQST